MPVRWTVLLVLLAAMFAVAACQHPPERDQTRGGPVSGAYIGGAGGWGW